MDRDHLYRRLRRVEALATRGATEGEQAAARRAAARIRIRIRASASKTTSTPRASARPDPIEIGRPELHLPSRSGIVSVLRAWQLGELEDMEVGEWARTFIDGLLLPDLPADHPDSIPIEVLLQLSTLPNSPVGHSHIDHLLDFLDTPHDATRSGWSRWFARVTEQSDQR